MPTTPFKPNRVSHHACAWLLENVRRRGARNLIFTLMFDWGA